MLIKGMTYFSRIHMYVYIYIYVYRAMSLFSCRFLESMLVNYAIPCRNWTFQLFAMVATLAKRWKVQFIRIQVLSTDTVDQWVEQRRDNPKTWVRILASVIFFICSVAFFLLCYPYEALEGQLWTVMNTINKTSCR